MSLSNDINAVVKPLADAADAEIANLKAQLSAVQGSLADANGSIDFLEEVVEDLRAETGTLENLNVALKDEIATLKARIAELEGASLKPALRGLVTTDPAYVAGNIPYAEFASTKPRWKDYNPSPDVFNFSAIDTMLAKYPNLKFRLRFMAGIHAPDWAKVRSGGAVHHDPNTGTGGTGEVPRFWTENYYQDYMTFMAAVADHFEDNPQVVEITNSLTTTVYAEPFILNADPATVTRYWNAGYRFPAVQTNLMRSMHGMMDLFPTTRISLAGHGKWERIIDGKMNYDWPSERAVFNELINTYGPRLVLDDHGLDDGDAIGVPQPSDTAATWYNYMAGCEDTEQTYGWQFTMKAGSNKTTAADMGVTMGACFEEFAGFNDIPEPKRRQIHDALLANAEGKP